MPGKLHCLPPGTAAADSKTLIFIRHGETDYNLACTGSSGNKGSKPVGGPDGTMSMDPFAYEDSCLTATGLRQAQSLGAKLTEASPPVELVVASPLERTLQTAAGIFPVPPGGKIVAHEKVREMMFAKYESYNKRGLKSAKAARFPQIDFGLIDEEADVMFAACAASEAGRERSVEVQQRISEFLEWVMERPESVIAVVSHGFAMNLSFGADYIHHIFEVEAADLEACRLKSGANTATHEVVISRQPPPNRDSIVQPARVAVTRSTPALHERNEQHKREGAASAGARIGGGLALRYLRKLGVPALLLALLVWMWRRGRRR